MKYQVQKNKVVFDDGANIIIRSLSDGFEQYWVFAKNSVGAVVFSDILKASEYLEDLEKGE